ncbi:MAG: hypothetical protein HY459_00230 [Parcubacteria group bacterium]|nr:hypothetical protein [Parcubacteria group bacterium]
MPEKDTGANTPEKDLNKREQKGKVEHSSESPVERTQERARLSPEQLLTQELGELSRSTELILSIVRHRPPEEGPHALPSEEDVSRPPPWHTIEQAKETLRQEAETLDTIWDQLLEGAVGALLKELESFELRSLHDIERMNTLLENIRSVIRNAEEVLANHEATQQRADSLYQRYQRERLHDAGFTSTDELRNALDAKLDEAIQLDRSWIRKLFPSHKKKLTEAETQAQRLQTLTFLMTPSTISTEVKSAHGRSELEEFESRLAEIMAKRVARFYEERLSAVKEQLSQEPTTLDDETIDRLNDDFLARFVTPLLEQSSTRFKPETIARGFAVLKRSFHLGRYPMRYDPAEVRLHQDTKQEYEQLPERLQWLLNAFTIQREGSGDERFEKYAEFVARAPWYTAREKLSSAYLAFIQATADIGRGAYTLGATDMASKAIEIKRMVDRMIGQFDERRWIAFRDNDGIREQFGESALSSAEQLLRREVADRLIRETRERGEDVKLGFILSSLRDAATLPIVLLNSYRARDHSGDNPFLSDIHPSTETNLFQTIDGLSAAELSALERKEVPGLMELIRLIKENPETFRDHAHTNEVTGKQEENPIYKKIHRELGALALHFFRRGDEKMRRYLLTLFYRMDADLEGEICTAIKDSMHDTNDSEYHKLALAIFENQILHRFNDNAISPYREILRDTDDVVVFEQTLEGLAKTIQDVSMRKRDPEYPREWRLRLESFMDSLRDALEAGIDKILRLASVKGMLHLLEGYTALGVDTPKFRAFLASDLLKERVAEMIQSHPHETPEILARRFMELNDQEALARLFEGFSSLDQPDARGAASGSLTEILTEHKIRGVDNTGNIVKYETLRDTLAAQLGSKNLPLARHIAQIFVKTIDEMHKAFSLRKSVLEQEWRSPYEADTATLIVKAGEKALAESDPILRYQGCMMVARLEPPPMGYHHALVSLAGDLETITAYEKGSAEKLAMCIAEVASTLEDDDIRYVLSHLESFSLLGQDTLKEALLTLALISTRFPPDISAEIASRFENLSLPHKTLEKLVEDRDSLSHENWARLLTAYLMIEGGDWVQIEQTRKEEVQNLFSIREHPEHASFCFEKLYAQWHAFLEDATTERLPLQAAVIAHTVHNEGGAGPLKYIESLAFLMHELRISFRDPHVVTRTKSEIKSGFLRQEERFAKERWSEEDKSFFYDLAAEILHAAPSLYSEFAQLFDTLSPKELKGFAKEQLPFYQAQLVLLQSDEKEHASYNPRELVRVRRGLRSFIEELTESTDESRAGVFARERERLLTVLQQGFETRFGLLKVPEELDHEGIRSIQNITRYLGNIAKRDQEKETLLGWYLALKLHGRWEDYRRGNAVDPAEFFEGERLRLLERHLRERGRLDGVTAEKLGVGKETFPRFRELLQEETISNLIGNVETIDVKLRNVTGNLEALADPDTYTDENDKNLLVLLNAHGGKLVNRVLAKTYQATSGKAIEFSEKERSVQGSLAATFKVEAWTSEKVKELQERAKTISLVVGVLEHLKERKIDEGIEELRTRLSPSPQIIEIFQRLGEPFKTESGALALSQDLAYLENIIVKDADKLGEDEKRLLSEYLASIRETMQRLEESLDRIKEGFGKMKKSVHASADEALRNRLAEIEKALFTKASTTEIMSRITGNLNLIIENIRQCLGCLRKEINNDTNLTFGDSNKFFVMSQSPEVKRSIADQIVMLVPIERAEHEREMSFVFDTLYGSKSSDVLIAHVMVVYKKFSQLKREFPEVRLSLLVTQAALASAGMTAELLAKRLTDEQHLAAVFEMAPEVTVDIPSSAAGDPYLEIGGGSRSTGPRVVNNGLLIY